MVEHLSASFVTTTTYGSWLPGDVRGYVEKGVLLPASPSPSAYATSRMKASTVHFSDSDREALHESIVAAALEFGYRLSDFVIEATHLHWIVAHEDEMETMVGRLKNRMRQRLNRGRIWTAGYCGVEIRSLKGLHDARNYLAQHRGLRALAGQIASDTAPGSARGRTANGAASCGMVRDPPAEPGARDAADADRG